VFENTHRLLFELIGEGKIDGLRIDHPDGLRAPEQYFHRLQGRVGPLYGGTAHGPAGSWACELVRPVNPARGSGLPFSR